MGGVVDGIAAAVSSPWFRFLTFSISFVSLAMSIWVFRRTMNVLRVQKANILSGQIQHVNQQWQDLYKIILTDEKTQKLATKAIGFSSIDETRKLYFYFMLLNPINFEYQASKLGIMDENFFRQDMLSIARNFRGDRAELLRMIKIGEYSDGFVELCRKYLTEHFPQSLEEPEKRATPG
jgi:hypothetical protein